MTTTGAAADGVVEGKDSSSTTTTPSVTLTKKQNGRLKKLRKRAKTASVYTETSGLSSKGDWEELQELLQKKQEDLTGAGPSVLWRQGKTRERVEGSDHRDILHTLLTPGTTTAQNGKKRKRNDNLATEATAIT
jgi:hypothetical protein